MLKNYILLVHNNPAQLKRLIEKLDDGYSKFYIHVDKLSDISSFEKEFISFSNVKFILNRENGTWGGIGIVLGTLNAIDEIIKDKNKGHLILLSGQDYPLKSNEEINAYLLANKDVNFIDIAPIKEVFPQEWNKRMFYYKYNLSNQKGKYILVPTLFSKSILEINTLKVIAKIIIHHKGFSFLKEVLSNLLKKRNVPTNINLKAGGQWWALTNETAKKIITFSKENTELLDYFKYTVLPDEMYFQTVIHHFIENGHSINIKPMITYVNWERKGCDLPVTFISSDYDELISQKNKLFARKFNTNIDCTILDKLDQLHKK